MIEEHQFSPNNQHEIAALKIQKLWRSYTNRKIYKYYRDIIFFKCKGNPAKLLKGINPLEAQLLQSSSNCHVRFRLGGDTFPPNIYYKIFTKTGVVDINSFAPRDYATLPRNKNIDKISIAEYKSKKQEYEQEGWYLRNDNNGWRPISHKMFVKSDYVQLYSANKVRYYHHKKQKRLEKCSKKARIAKLKWLQNLYKNAKKQQEVEILVKMQKAEEQNNTQLLQKVKDQLQQQHESSKLLENKINKQFPEVQDEEEFEKEVKELIQWSQNLDYDNYARQWFQLSTSQPSSNFVPRFVNANSNIIREQKPQETFKQQNSK